MKTLKFTGLFLASVLLVSAADAAPVAVAASALTWQNVVLAVTAVVLAARAIVKLTPTPADDSYVEKVVTFLKHVGLHID